MKDKKKDERKDSTLKFVHDTLRIPDSLINSRLKQNYIGEG